EGDRVDAEEGVVVLDAEQGLELSRRARAPAPRLLDGGQFLFELLLVDLHLIAATDFCAASHRPSAWMILIPDLARISLPSFTLVPSRRTTSGTLRSIFLSASRMPCAMTSHFMMPPKMLTSTASTFLSLSRISKAVRTWSTLAPPPTSRKFAGLPPA